MDAYTRNKITQSVELSIVLYPAAVYLLSVLKVLIFQARCKEMLRSGVFALHVPIGTSSLLASGASQCLLEASLGQEGLWMLLIPLLNRIVQKVSEIC